MMLRPIAFCAVLAACLLPGQALVAAPACDGAECAPVNNKPLNIMQFMREQAASTRVGETQPRKNRVTSKAKAHASGTKAKSAAAKKPPAVVASPKSVGLPAEAATSFASQPSPATQVAGSGELGPADLAATPAPLPSETTEGPLTTGPDVQLVAADEFNDIDRKAGDSMAQAIEQTPEPAPAHVDQAKVSWLRWMWSALGNTFAALAAAAHHLIGLA